MACTASYQKYRASVTHVLNHLRYPCLEPGPGKIQLEKLISRREIKGCVGIYDFRVFADGHMIFDLEEWLLGVAT